MTENEIFEFLKNVLTDYFEIDANKITMDARLNEDLDVDSIDAIDIMSYIKKETGREIEPAQFKEVKTIRDIIDIIMKQMNNNENN